MCGVFGWLGPSLDATQASEMRDLLSHRGPDSFGHWYDDESKIWLGHRRLAIIDLTPTGNQPMVSSYGRYVAVFNGEIFNYKELKDDLVKEGYSFQGQSDTEVMLTAIERWGIKGAVSQFIGMFAIAIWDRHSSTLSLVRDRLGIKPLYYSHQGDNFAFSSELRPLAKMPWLSNEIDLVSVSEYLRFLCVPAPRSILSGVNKLEPGGILTLSSDSLHIEKYWDLQHKVKEGLAAPINLSFKQSADELEEKLENAVKIRMRCDVPYGAFLSGGVDSALVAALMSKHSSSPIHTFTIGFDDQSHDESVYAREVAKHLGTQHHEETMSAQTVIDLMDDIAILHDEPFADSSSLPTYLLSKFARKHVTVALSGDGGDELFGGYPRYFWADRIQSWQHRLGPAGVGVVSGVMSGLPDWIWDGPVNTIFGKRFSGTNGLSGRVNRLAQYLRTKPEESDNNMVAAWRDPSSVMSGRVPLTNRYSKWQGLGWSDQMMAVDQAEYLPNDILTKVDRTSMAVSLETRVPILDHRLVEWSWRVPPDYKLAGSGDRGKLLLREVLYRHVPKELIERPKMGFGMPIDKWLRGPLRSWAEELISEKAISEVGLLRADVVHTVWSEHLSGINRVPQIWPILMLQDWVIRWRKSI